MNKTKTVVLDGYAVNPGDLDWDRLQAFGECTVYERTPPEAVIERASGATVILTNKTRLDRNTIAELPLLKYIGVLATGYDVVDIDEARARGIPVSNVPAYSSPAVAQMVFSLILELTHHVGYHAQTVKEGRWCRSRDWCYWDFPLVELSGLTMGVVGHGNIGRSVARIGRAFGMNILTCSKTTAPSSSEVRSVDLNTLFREADVLTLHCPLTAETLGMVNFGQISMMKHTAMLINTSRGALIIEQDLADALNTDRIAGAGIDVLASEPPQPGNPLLQAKNCLITPHIAWATRAARSRLIDIAVGNVKAFLDGRPKNLVN